MITEYSVDMKSKEVIAARVAVLICETLLEKTLSARKNTESEKQKIVKNIKARSVKVN